MVERESSESSLKLLLFPYDGDDRKGFWRGPCKHCGRYLDHILGSHDHVDCEDPTFGFLTMVARDDEVTGLYDWACE